MAPKLGLGWWWLAVASLIAVPLYVAQFWFVLLSPSFVSEELAAIRRISAPVGLLIWFVVVVNLVVRFFGWRTIPHKYLGMVYWLYGLAYSLINPGLAIIAMPISFIGGVVFWLDYRPSGYRPRRPRKQRSRIEGYVCRSCTHRGSGSASTCGNCGSDNLRMIEKEQRIKPNRTRTLLTRNGRSKPLLAFIILTSLALYALLLIDTGWVDIISNLIPVFLGI